MRSSVNLYERLISALSYLSAGWVGIIAIIVYAVGKKKLPYYLRYNILQSIFIALLLYVISLVVNLVMWVLGIIPFIKIIVAQIGLFFNMPIILGYSLAQLFVFGLIMYTIFNCIIGKIPKIYWISDIVDYATK